MLLCILLTFSVSSADEESIACPTCGNTDLKWFTLATSDGRDAHSRFCEPCYTMISGTMEYCTPIEGSATCVTAPRCQVCGYSMSTTLQPDPDAHFWSDPQYQWNTQDGATAEGFPVFTCTAFRYCKNSCGTAQQETVIASAVQTTPSTCITQGTIAYTASFEASWAETQVDDRLAGAPYADHTVWRDTKYYFAHKESDSDIPEYYCIAYRQCDDCYEIEEERVEATYAITLEPTCTEDGKITYTAVFESEWAEAYSAVLVTIPAAGHSYETKKVEPTCAKGGYTKRTCTVCGDTNTYAKTKARSHWYGLWTPNLDGTHSAECKRSGCDNAGTTECTLFEMTVTIGETETILTVCPVCGDHEDAPFAAIPDASIKEVSKDAIPSGELIVRGMDAPIDGVLYAFTAAYEQAGKIKPFNGNVSITIPLDAEKYTGFKLVRVDVTPATETEPRAEVWTDIAFTSTDSSLTFKTNTAGLFLLMPQ